MQLTAKDLMGKEPKTIDAEARLNEAEEMMNDNKITSLLVKEQGKVAGVIQIYDLNG